MNELTQTVAAVSTARGKGGIAVIRISGENAVSVASAVFRPKNGVSLADTRSGRAVFGEIIYENQVIDEGIAVIFRAPKSFTGEDVAEISCHGGILLTETVLRSVFAAGAFPAGPGEFTKRAFLNGKMSLSEAEAVAELIDADTSEKLRLSSALSRGRLAHRCEAAAERIKVLTAGIYVDSDYPGEQLSDITEERFAEELCAVTNDVRALKNSYKAGKAVMEGILTVIVGKPNAGKSSLLNMLLGEERAIVTSTAGTTRDIIEEKLQLGKAALRLCDTAGIRGTSDEVEKLGVERALAKMDQAELIFAVIDGSQPIDTDSRILLDKLENIEKPVVVIINKCDLESAVQNVDIGNFDYTVRLSSVTGEGKEKLAAIVDELFETEKISENDGAVISNARQYAAVSGALDALEAAKAAFDAGFPPDVAGLDLEDALSRLAELDGRAVSEEITNEIFSRFCVGK